MDDQGITWRRNIAENFNRLSSVHQRYRRQTDRQTTDDRQTDGRWHIANMNLSSRSLKIMIKILNCKSESLANGEKQIERSWCVEMVADCSKRSAGLSNVHTCTHVHMRPHQFWTFFLKAPRKRCTLCPDISIPDRSIRPCPNVRTLDCERTSSQFSARTSSDGGTSRRRDRRCGSDERKATRSAMYDGHRWVMTWCVKNCEFELDTVLDRQPVKLAKCWSITGHISRVPFLSLLSWSPVQVAFLNQSWRSIGQTRVFGQGCASNSYPSPKQTSPKLAGFSRLNDKSEIYSTDCHDIFGLLHIINAASRVALVCFVCVICIP